MNEPEKKDWREIAEAARNETDPKRLLELVEELNRALERKGEVAQRNSHPSHPNQSLCLV